MKEFAHDVQKLVRQKIEMKTDDILGMNGHGIRIVVDRLFPFNRVLAVSVTA